MKLSIIHNRAVTARRFKDIHVFINNHGSEIWVLIKVTYDSCTEQSFLGSVFLSRRKYVNLYEIKLYLEDKEKPDEYCPCNFREDYSKLVQLLKKYVRSANRCGDLLGYKPFCEETFGDIRFYIDDTISVKFQQRPEEKAKDTDDYDFGISEGKEYSLTDNSLDWLD